MKKIYFLVCFITSIVYCQVGINTNNPETTLDIRGINNGGAVTATDGILIPRVNDLTASGKENGQLVYLTSNIGSFKSGFHYWNGTAWTPINTNDNLGNHTANQNLKMENYSIENANQITMNSQLNIEDRGNGTVYGDNFTALYKTADVTHFWNSGVGNMVSITDNSKLGINNSSPTSRLDVRDGVGGLSVTDSIGRAIARFRGAGNILDITAASSSPWGMGIQSRSEVSPTVKYPLILQPMGGNIGIGTNNPNSVLDVVSTTSGFSMPRMNTEERDAIVSPPSGTQVYNTVSNSINFNSGTPSNPIWSVLQSTSLPSELFLNDLNFVTASTINTQQKLIGISEAANFNPASYTVGTDSFTVNYTGMAEVCSGGIQWGGYSNATIPADNYLRISIIKNGNSQVNIFTNPTSTNTGSYNVYGCAIVNFNTGDVVSIYNQSSFTDRNSALTTFRVKRLN